MKQYRIIQCHDYFEIEVKDRLWWNKVGHSVSMGNWNAEQFKTKEEARKWIQDTKEEARAKELRKIRIVVGEITI